MDSVLDLLLRCQPGHEQLHLIIITLSGLASLAAVIGAAYRLWRWWVGPSGSQRRAARLLRNGGNYHAQLNHRARAMDFYDSSIRLNPRAAHVYYLRGNLHYQMGNISRAIADWKRCLDRLPRHAHARKRLEENGITDFPPMFPFPWPTAAGTFAGVLLLALVGWLGFMILRQHMDVRSVDAILYRSSAPHHQR
jgi:tetratricopeptide (TPR) repeat protein